MIESYYHQNISVVQIATYLNRTRTPIYTVINFLKEGHTAIEYYQQYKENKKHCGRHKIVLSKKQQSYIKEKVAQGWTPDVIVGRAEESLKCSVRKLYRQFKEKIFDKTTLPMKGKSKPNRRKASNIELAMNHWFQVIPRNLFHSITFDCGKEFSNWKSLCNQHDVAIYFADPGTPSQRALNENSNDLLRKYGLPKEMDFNQVDNCLFPPLQIREIIFQEKH